jgi:hypothetical protein
MAWKILRLEQIRDFKQSWPCHGLPDDLDTLACEFADNGDLIDMEALNHDGETLDTHDFDGPALLALTQDCQEFGETTESE